jgi:hypothetical protein
MTGLFEERDCFSEVNNRVLFSFCRNGKGTELVLMCVPVTESGVSALNEDA